MYQYALADNELLNSRTNQFKDQISRRIDGSLSEDEFRPLRLMNGLYLEMHAYMLRIAIPYGVLSSNQLHKLADVSDRFDRGYGHFTTRQNIQLNWIELDQASDILSHLSDANLHAIQSSGNCIRSVTADPYAGAGADEVADPRPTAELIRQWSCLHPEFAFLGRKFKIAVTGSEHDRASIRVHDIGVQLVRNEAGEAGYKLFVGGGLGRTPMVGKVLSEFLPENELLAYLEAALRVYNLDGRRDNKYKARIKILTRDLGVNNLRERIDAEYNGCRSQLPDTSNWLRHVESQFKLPTFDDASSDAAVYVTDSNPITDKSLARWIKTNVISHRVDGYSIVNISLKPVNGIPGDVTSEQMHLLADLAKRFSSDEIRVTKNQNLVLPHVKTKDLTALYDILKRHSLAEANHGLLTDVVSCPGMDYCSLATARSIPIAQEISQRFADPETQDLVGKIAIKISGCINACGHHHIGQIGILGLEKGGKEYYQLVLGGDDSEFATIGKVTGPGFSSEEIVDAVATVIDVYLELRLEDELFVDTQRRLGSKPFKEVLYATH